MDTTGLVALEDIYHDLKRHDCRLILSGLQPEVQQLLERSGLLNEIGRSNCFDTTDEAIHSLRPVVESVADNPNPKVEELAGTRE